MQRELNPGSARALACTVRRFAEQTPRHPPLKPVLDLNHVQRLRRGRRNQHARRVCSPAFCVAFLVAAAAFAHGRAFAAEVIPPKPDHYFNDYAAVVSKEAADRFNQQLEQFERETSDQVVVAVYPKMQSDSSIADYTQRVAQAWGVGQKEQRNGVVLFVFIQDRKMFIQVGYGLEGALPDVTAFDITEYRIKPRFRENDYEGGLAAGIDSICKAIRGEYKGTGKTVAEQHGGSAAPSFLFFIVFIIVLIAISGLMRQFGGYGYSARGGGPIFFPMGGGGGGGWSSGGGGFSGGGGSFGGGGAGSSW